VKAALCGGRRRRGAGGGVCGLKVVSVRWADESHPLGSRTRNPFVHASRLGHSVQEASRVEPFHGGAAVDDPANGRRGGRTRPGHLEPAAPAADNPSWTAV